PQIQGPAYRLRRLHRLNKIEVRGFPKSIDEAPADRALVFVIEDGRQVLDVRVDGVAVNHELDERHHDNDHQRPPVPDNMQELLLEDRQDAIQGFPPRSMRTRPQATPHWAQ